MGASFSQEDDDHCALCVGPANLTAFLPTFVGEGMDAPAGLGCRRQKRIPGGSEGARMGGMTETDHEQRQFDVLFSTLRELQMGLLDSTAKVAGFLLLATGWLVTSERARTLMHDQSARYLAATALAGAFVLYGCASVKAFLISQKTLSLLKRLKFMPATHYESRAVDPLTLLIFVVSNFFLVCLAAGLVLRAA
jgi:hypothetical protein